MLTFSEEKKRGNWRDRRDNRGKKKIQPGQKKYIDAEVELDLCVVQCGCSFCVAICLFHLLGD